MSSVVSIFEKIAKQNPLKLALSNDHETLTYKQLDYQSSLVAQCLFNHGLSGQLFCLHFASSIELIVSILGVLKVGGTYICLDKNYPQKRKQYIIDKSCANVLLTMDHLDVTVSLQLLYINLLNEPLTYTYSCQKNPIISVVFTSGSTGEPKGIQLSQDNLLSFIKNHSDITSADCMPQLSSISFDAFQFELWAILLNGGCLSFLPSKTLVNPAALQAAIAKHRITMAFVTTALVNLGVLKYFVGQPTFRRVYFGGEELKANALKQDFPNFDFELEHCYGPSETSIWNVSHRVDAWSDQIPLGIPLANSKVLLLDEQGCVVNEPCQLGEIHIGGECVSHGYLHDETLTKASFVDINGQRYFKTSDIAYWNDSHQLVYSHRVGNTVKHNGYRVNLNEIDRAIQSIDSTIQSITALVSNRGQNHLTAFYCHSALDELTVRNRLADTLPDYMRPTYIFKVEAFPITPHGKVDIRALCQYQVNRQSTLLETKDSAEIILSIWRELLGNPAIDLDDKYFESGGNSVLLLKLQREINSRFCVKVKVSELFSHTTPVEQAELVDNLLAQ